MYMYKNTHTYMHYIISYGAALCYAALRYVALCYTLRRYTATHLCAHTHTSAHISNAGIHKTRACTCIHDTRFMSPSASKHCQPV